MIPTITPIELHSELKGPNPPTIIDVREAHELELSALPGAIHIPLGSLPGHLDEFELDTDFVILCRSGMRSAQATLFMLQHGFTRVRNVESGINGWARTVDSSMSEY